MNDGELKNDSGDLVTHGGFVPEPAGDYAKVLHSARTTSNGDGDIQVRFHTEVVR